MLTSKTAPERQTFAQFCTFDFKLTDERTKKIKIMGRNLNEPLQLAWYTIPFVFFPLVFCILMGPCLRSATYDNNGHSSKLEPYITPEKKICTQLILQRASDLFFSLSRLIVRGAFKIITGEDGSIFTVCAETEYAVHVNHSVGMCDIMIHWIIFLKKINS